MNLAERDAPLFINGLFRAGTGPVLQVLDPSSGTVFASLRSASPAEVALAADAAARAFLPWSQTSGQARAGCLRGFAAGLAARREALIALQMLNNGKPRLEAEIDVGDAIATFEYYAAEAVRLDARQGSPVEMPEGLGGRTRFDPVGPVGLIVPWNFPLVTSAWKIAPALAAGCTLVMKTSEFTPLIELVYGDIAAEAGLPPGVLNLVTGAAETGAAITANPRFRKLSFTGSNGVGARVMAAAAERCLPIALELGGKSPIVVLDDADPELAADCIAAGIFFNAGQMCSATSRAVLDKAIADEVLDRLAAKAAALQVGPPGEGAAMGPITTAPQHERVLQTLDQARAEGLRCITGGRRITGPGFFVQPTIYADVPPANRVWRDEIFGPVLATCRVRGDEAAIAAANDTAYGLVATVVSADPDRAGQVANRLEAGHIWINSAQIIPPQTAWGGFKASGIGRELGPWGLSAYLGVKHITVAA